jgi:hypothetical protein
MNCKKVQELILGDYIDDQLRIGMRKNVDYHLAQCEECRAFANTVRSTTLTPFETAQILNAPEYVWHRIKDQIIREKPVKAGFNARYIFSLVPKPVFTTAVIVLVIANLLAFNIINFRKPGAITLKGGDTVLTYLEGDQKADLSDYSLDFGTDIEKNFL